MASNTDAAGITDSAIVRGTVQFYDAEKKFGFVEVGRDRVFFHQSACRVVEGTPEEPVFTNRKNDQAPVWWKGIRRPSEIILRLVRGSRGLKAAVWGYRPTRTWLEELLHWNRLAQYADGHIEMRWSQRYRGRAYSEMTARLIGTPLLQPGDPWKLGLEYDVYDGAFRTYSPPTRREQNVVLLNQYDAQMREHGERMSIEIYSPDADEWMTITFYPHSWWRAWKAGDS